MRWGSAKLRGASQINEISGVVEPYGIVDELFHQVFERMMASVQARE